MKEELKDINFDIFDILELITDDARETEIKINFIDEDIYEVRFSDIRDDMLLLDFINNNLSKDGIANLKEW